MIEIWTDRGTQTRLRARHDRDGTDRGTDTEILDKHFLYFVSMFRGQTRLRQARHDRDLDRQRDTDTIKGKA